MEGECAGYEITKREEDGLYVFYWQDEFGGGWSTDLLGPNLDQGVFETYEQAETAANEYYETR
jgi:hypothetical protein